MNEEELRELQDPASWDDEGTEVHTPVKQARAVVSVSFGREDFDQVTEAAQQAGMKVSAFVREAALERLRQMRQPRRGGFSVSTGQSGVISGDFTSASRSRLKKDPSKQNDDRLVTS